MQYKQLMSWLSELFGGGGGIREALQEGAVIIDLRTAYDYDQGHIPRSLNIPADRIRANIDRIRDLRRPVILCCGAGGQCWEAVDYLRSAGLPRVINGGDWQSLLRKMQR
jgi:rhodanese-related sulfurtransferase